MLFTKTILIISLVISEIFCGTFENDECLVDEKEGRCLLIENCPNAIAGIKSGIHPKNCGFEGKRPIVCCISQNGDQSNTNGGYPTHNGDQWSQNEGQFNQGGKPPNQNWSSNKNGQNGGTNQNIGYPTQNVGPWNQNEGQFNQRGKPPNTATENWQSSQNGESNQNFGPNQNGASWNPNGGTFTQNEGQFNQGGRPPNTATENWQSSQNGGSNQNFGPNQNGASWNPDGGTLNQNEGQFNQGGVQSNQNGQWSQDGNQNGPFKQNVEPSSHGKVPHNGDQFKQGGQSTINGGQSSGGFWQDKDKLIQNGGQNGNNNNGGQLIQNGGNRRRLHEEMCKQFINEIKIQKAKDDGKFWVTVVGGHNAKAGEYPHMALLGYGDKPKIEWSCGGSLISKTYILTAAHCLTHPILGDVKHVRLGDIRLDGTSGTAQDFQIIRKIRHPEYKGPLIYNDIALLEINKPVKFTSDVKPACLHSEKDVKDIKYFDATGWGLTEHGGNPAEILQAVYLDIFTHQECNNTYKNNGRRVPYGILDDRQICAGGRDRIQDTCQGDSGGPLQWKKGGEDELHRIIGVTSLGKGCGLPDVPAIYTRVAHYIPWIEDIVF